LFPKRFAQSRQRRDRTGRKSKALWWFSRDFNLPNSDVDMSRLIAMSGSNVSSVDHHHYLGREIGIWLECRRHRGFEIGNGTMRSIAHGCVIHRPTGRSIPRSRAASR
jgi:hypothetical protein